MRIRQVFRTYDANNRVDKDKQVFCSTCGKECIRETGDGSTRSICPDCGAVHHRNPSPAVSILIAEDSRFLLCKRKVASFRGGQWCLPCGFIEYDEDYLSAAVREAREETGLDIEIRSILSVVSNFFKPDLHSLVVVLLAQPVGGDIGTQDDEIDSVRWFSTGEELPEMAFEADAHIIDRYFNSGLVGVPVDSESSDASRLN